MNPNWLPMKLKQKSLEQIIHKVPEYNNDLDRIDLLYANEVDWQYMNAMKNMSDCTDETLSGFLNLSVKTFREYKKPNAAFNAQLQEHVLMILALFKQGQALFGSMTLFEHWLNEPHFYFNGKAPAAFLNTVSGIKFIGDRLTGMLYGDNA